MGGYKAGALSEKARGSVWSGSWLAQKGLSHTSLFYALLSPASLSLLPSIPPTPSLLA